MLGLKRKTIVEFSFLLAVPTMVCATGLDLAKTAHSFTFVQFKYLFIGFTISFIAALLAIKFLLSFIRNNGFILFGVYRIILALLLWSIFRIL
jgi:undecaprenyl-diphosphatase